MKKEILYRYPIRLLFFIRSIFARDKQLRICTSEETIKLIQENRMSCSRFGDGELKIMRGESIGFQSYDKILAKRLEEVIRSSLEKHLVCIPYYLMNMSILNDESKTFWQYSLLRNRKVWDFYLNADKLYGDTQFTRFYMNAKDKRAAVSLINKIKRLWTDRNLVIVEGAESRLGIGNDLFQNVSSIKRVICPVENAFSCYNEILDACLQYDDKDCLFVLALGPTATVLAYDLSLRGYQALDLGHIDVEYEWYLRRCTSKIPIDGKYVNECHIRGGVIKNEEYDSQIDVIIR